MSGRLWAHVSSTSSSYNSSCVARQDHCLLKASADGVLRISRDPERQRDGVDIKLYIHTPKYLFYRLLKAIVYQIFSLSFLQYKHLFVHIGPSNPSYSDPVLESIDVRQIYDKFSEKKGGLKELYEKGPRNAFFLVKFWVSTKQNSIPLLIKDQDFHLQMLFSKETQYPSYNLLNWSRSVIALVSGGPKQRHRGGLKCFLWREQSVQWDRKHHHQRLYEGLLLWQTSSRESWGKLSPVLLWFYAYCFLLIAHSSPP